MFGALTDLNFVYAGLSFGLSLFENVFSIIIAYLCLHSFSYYPEWLKVNYITALRLSKFGLLRSKVDLLLKLFQSIKVLLHESTVVSHQAVNDVLRTICYLELAVNEAVHIQAFILVYIDAHYKQGATRGRLACSENGVLSNLDLLSCILIVVAYYFLDTLMSGY